MHLFIPISTRLRIGTFSFKRSLPLQVALLSWVDAQGLTALSVPTVANAIFEKVNAKVNAAYKEPDVDVLEKLIGSMVPEARKYVETTINNYSADIDARLKSATDGLNALTAPLMKKRKQIIDLQYPKQMAKYQISNVFNSFDDAVTDFSRNTLVRFSELLTASQDSVLNELQARIDEIRNRITEALNIYVRADEEHARAVNEALRMS